MDVSACFQPQSQAGLELLDFFLESDTRRLPPPAKRAILARLKTLCNRRNNSWLMNHPMAVFTVLKGGRKRIIFAGLKVDEKAIQNDTCAIEV